MDDRGGARTSCKTILVGPEELGAVGPEPLRRISGWTGGEHATFQDANAERLAHLNRHILASQATIAVGQGGAS